MSFQNHSLALRLCAVAGLTAGTALLAGCGGDDASGPATGRQVAAAFYPLAYVAERVAGEQAEVTNLTSPGGEPHDLELGVAQITLVSESDLVIVEQGFQPAVDDAVAQNATGEVLDVSEVVTLSRQRDPHFWQDPLLMADLADAVAARLGEIDPEHASAYEENAAALRGDLEALDAEYASGLESCERATVVVSHDAFGYLSRYGLEFEPIAGLSPDAEPTPADLARLQTLIQAEGITTVFSETLVSPKMAESLADDLGIRTAVLDPIEGLTDASGDEDYLSLMRTNLAALAQANGC